MVGQLSTYDRAISARKPRWTSAFEASVKVKTGRSRLTKNRQLFAFIYIDFAQMSTVATNRCIISEIRFE